MSNEKALKVSAVLQGVAEDLDEFLQGVAEGLDEFLEVAAGERIGFAMVLDTDGLAQYVANVERKDGVAMLAALFQRWSKNQPDIPAHADPEIIAPGRPRHHELKTDHDPFDAVLAGYKTFEIRRNDRDYQTNDTLTLRETVYTGEQMAAGEPLLYTGRAVDAIVTHVMKGPIYGIAEGWAVLSIKGRGQE